MLHSSASPSLIEVFRGWDGYQVSLVRALEPRSAQELAYRASPQMRSVGEIAAHIGIGRIDWFHRMGAPGAAELADEVAGIWRPGGEIAAESGVATDAARLVHLLDSSWRMVERNLTTWTVADLQKTYRHSYWGKTYAISRQWTIWRIMAHDIYHGGQLSALLSSIGVDLPELTGQGGHLTEVPLADELEEIP